MIEGRALWTSFLGALLALIVFSIGSCMLRGL
jgi:hypothetical protein